MKFIEINGFNSNGEKVFHWEGYCYPGEIDVQVDAALFRKDVKDVSWNVV